MKDIQVIPLNEGYYTIGFDKIFYPFDKEKDILEERSRGSLLVEIQPFLLITENKKILIDTGLGFTNPETGNLKIEDNLARQDIRPEDITDVVMSHLHKDHAGGFFKETQQGRSVLFKNAFFHINKNEFEYAIDEANKMSYEPKDIILLQDAAKIQWFDNGFVFDFMKYEEDGGHCPFHTSFLISSNAGQYFFGGDVAPQLKQLKFRYKAKYDFDENRSMELRSEYAKRGKDEDWTFLFYHDVSTPMAKL
jgi:glyoxylase-like metal-dependent hydrolase (beta-lactamase superfamily II)